jgi:hypothetical protein
MNKNKEMLKTAASIFTKLYIGFIFLGIIFEIMRTTYGFNFIPEFTNIILTWLMLLFVPVMIITWSIATRSAVLIYYIGFMLFIGVGYEYFFRGNNQIMQNKSELTFEPTNLISVSSELWEQIENDFKEGRFKNFNELKDLIERLIEESIEEAREEWLSDLEDEASSYCPDVYDCI